MSMRLRFLAAVLGSAALLSCGPGAIKPGPVVVNPDNAEKIMDPAGQAAILGTDENGGSTLIPLRKDESTVDVDAMVVFAGAVPVYGDTKPVKLTTSQNKDGQVQIGVSESVLGGVGPQMRAGVWISAFLASSTLNKDLTDFKFSAMVPDKVDGASASGLMTVGFIAALTGTPIDPEATMTGIINPDGTIGPVGGIPHKFMGSIEKGKKRLGFPVGQRMSMDFNTQQDVDLVKLAKDNGATATEISDIYGAYEHMTGQKLPRPVPVDAEEMELDDEVLEAFEKTYSTWQTDVAELWKQLVDLNNQGRLPQGLIQLGNLTGTEIDEAERQHKNGMASQAYRHIVDAWIYGISTTTTLEVLELVTAGDIIGAKARMYEYSALLDQTEPMMKKIGEMHPDTMGGHLLMLSAYEKGIAGLASMMSSSDSLQYTEMYLNQLAEMDPASLQTDYTVADATVQMVMPSVLMIARAVGNAQWATESMEIEAVKTLDYMCSLPNVKRLAKSFESAAQANVTYYETLVGVSDDWSRMSMQYEEPDYLTASVSSTLTQRGGIVDSLKAEWTEDSLPWGLFQLAAAQLGYFKASTLISKRYSLGVQNDPYSGRATYVAYEKAFMSMMTNAERKARENAHSAKVATGAIPVQARIAYQDAKLLREGDVADKLSALELYWKSSVYSQTAVMLARN